MSNDIIVGILRNRLQRFEARLNEMAIQHNALVADIAAKQAEASEMAGAHAELRGVVEELAETIREAE